MVNACILFMYFEIHKNSPILLQSVLLHRELLLAEGGITFH